MDDIRSIRQYRLILQGRKWTYSIFRMVILLGLAFVVLYPLIYMISVSFRSSADMSDPGVIWIPKNFDLQNFKDAWVFMEYPRSFLNTIQLSVISSFLQTASCAFVGYGFARFQFKGKEILFGLVLFTIIVPQSVVYMPTYLMFKDFDFLGVLYLIGIISGKSISVNLLDTPITMWLPNILGVGLRSGLFIYIFRQFYRNLPLELEDAAYIDGCGSLKTFLRIVLPNAMVAIITCLLFSIVWNWNDYFTVSMYYSNTKTVSVALVNLQDSMASVSAYESIRSDPYQLATRLQAGCVLCITPILILFFIMQRFFVQGIERTGIVG